jgi:hypothetical protein
MVFYKYLLDGFNGKKKGYNRYICFHSEVEGDKTRQEKRQEREGEKERKKKKEKNKITSNGKKTTPSSSPLSLLKYNKKENGRKKTLL